MTDTSSDQPTRPKGRGSIIVVFTRLPAAGRVKTRLVPLLGSRGAARLQADMISRTMGLVKRFATGGMADVEVHYEGGTGRDALRLLGDDVPIRPQSGRNLGERLREAADSCFRRGYRNVVIVGTDIPLLSDRQLDDALTLLRDHSVVLGPANDGGYYLIGLGHMVPGIFEGVTWGGGDVLSTTIEKARALDLRVALLDTLRDIDTPEDYRNWKEEEKED